MVRRVSDYESTKREDEQGSPRETIVKKEVL
jgi:hypothetical protein